MVELALLLPILVFGLIGAADLARAFAIQLAVQNGARAGAEAWAIASTPTVAKTATRVSDEVSRTPGIDLNLVDIVLPDGSQHADGTYCMSTPTVANPCFYTVTVNYEFHTIVPWPFVPNVAHFSRSTTMRTFY